MQDKFENPDQINIVPKEGQPKCSDLSCNNVGQAGCPSLGSPVEFTKEQMESFVQFALILKRIHMRLMAEGYTVNEAGKIIPPPYEKAYAKPVGKRNK